MWHTTGQRKKQRLSGWLPFRGLALERTVAVETNKRNDNDKPAAGVSRTRQRKQQLRMSIAKVEVESLPIARVGNSTTPH